MKNYIINQSNGQMLTYIIGNTYYIRTGTNLKSVSCAKLKNSFGLRLGVIFLSSSIFSIGPDLGFALQDLCLAVRAIFKPCDWATQFKKVE